MTTLKLFQFLNVGPVLLLLAGCSSTNISNRDPFYDYVGRSVELRCPVTVVARHGVWGSHEGVMSRRSADFGLVDRGSRNRRQVYGELPVGHRVWIDSVWDEVVVDGEQIIAYGRTTIPPGTNEVRFAYSWGFLWILKRAPWESDDTPEKRAPPGRLPPHFAYDMFKPPADIPKWGTKVRK